MTSPILSIEYSRCLDPCFNGVSLSIGMEGGAMGQVLRRVSHDPPVPRPGLTAKTARTPISRS